MFNLPDDEFRMNVSLPTDEEGYLGRECPQCGSYFKLILGTGLKGITDTICPYCGHKADGSEFSTDDQIEYAQSVTLRTFVDNYFQSLKRLEDIRPMQPNFLNIKVRVTEGDPIPIAHYTEKDLETKLVCTHCTLAYAVYSVFAFCPDCGQHNSLQILLSNFEVVDKLLNMADSVEGDVKEALLEFCLTKAVSAIDGYGRELCSLYAPKAANPTNAGKISFQNIDSARTHIQTHFGFDLAAILSPIEWDQVIRLFQKRHLFSHTAGEIDDKYIAKANDPQAIKGHKVILHKAELMTLNDLLKRVAIHIEAQMKSLFGNLM